MRRPLMVAAVVLATLNIIVEMAGARAVVYALKPLATLALVALVLYAGVPSRYRTGIAAGLSASLAGDILLMLPQGLFVPGLVAFLVAHLCYIASFALESGGWRAPRQLALPVYAVAVGILAFLWPTLGAMRIPVTAYVAVISTMAWQALARWQRLRRPDAALAAIGSVLFLASDASLAIRKFSAPFAGATLVILATYYLAQLGIALSVTERPDASS